jgi:hypothetical protein
VERLLRRSFGQYAEMYAEVPASEASDPRCPDEAVLGRYFNTKQASGVEVLFTDHAIYQIEQESMSRTTYTEMDHALEPTVALSAMNSVTLALRSGGTRRIWLDGGGVQRDAMMLYDFLASLGSARARGLTS